MGCLSTNKLASGLTLRCVHDAFHGCAHEYETPTQAACRIAGDALGVHPSRIGVTWRGSQIARVFVDGKCAGPSALVALASLIPLVNDYLSASATTSADKTRRLILNDRISRLDAAKIAEVERALDEIEVPAPTTADDEAHGRTLAYSVGIRAMWDDMSEVSRSLYVERARRLRKRWGCGERCPVDVAELELYRRSAARTIEQRDAFEETISEVAATLGCEDEWSNAHDHCNCVRENAATLREERDAAIRSADDAAARAERMVTRTEVSVDLMVQEVLRLRSELASAMATLESVALADDHLREVAGCVVGEFERAGTKNVGSLIQDLREALR